MKKIIFPPQHIAFILIGVLILSFFFQYAPPVQAQSDPGYYNTGEPCHNEDIGSDLCDYDSNGQPIQTLPTGKLYTGPNGNPGQIQPMVTTAKGCPTTPNTLRDVLCEATGIVNILLPIVAGATLIVFFWGLISMIRNSGDEKAVAAGKKLMIWGIVGLFVMVSVWGILNLFLGDFFGTTVGVPQLPA